MKEHIQKYLKYGYNVIPVNHDKTPACDWKYFQSNKIEEMTLFTTDSIAVVCGKISDNLEVLDFDNHGWLAKANITEYLKNPLIKTIYDKYKLPVIQTQSGGFHIYYRCETIAGNEKLAQVLLNGKPDTIIETRGEGGYVLAYPSPKYSIIRNDIADLQFITVDERTILHEVAKSFNEVVKKTQEFKPVIDNESPGKIYDSMPESIIEAKKLLSNAGWSEHGTYFWSRPGKSRGISATFGKVANNVFYCFTSNSEHFENDKAYTPFSIKSILEYNSDFSACAKDLVKKYNLHTTTKKEPEKKVIVELPKINFEKILKESTVFFDEVYDLPTTIVKIVDGNKWLDICTLGNFSCFTGKSKARKSFASHFFMSGMISNSNIQNKFIISLPENKRNIIYIDTEQSKPHVARSAFGIVKMANVSNIDNFQVICLRKYGYKDRCLFIQEVIEKTKNLGCVFIDGIADLAFGNNDEEEANRVVQLLMTWSAQYDIHINTVIHQPKGSDWATGHLGSAIEKKAESVINIKKDGNYSIFEPKQLRNCEDFTPFPFIINAERIPEIITESTVIDKYIDNEI